MSTESLLSAEFAREVAHWRAASERLGDPEAVAPAAAWQSLEHYLGVSLRGSLRSVVARLLRTVREMERVVGAGGMDPERWQAELTRVRQAYVRAETTIDFYSDALATRSSPRMGALLRACDHIATRSMAEVLTPLGREVPAAMTYLDKGLGASILKAGLRLWDGTEENVVAAIKVTRHNLLRPTAIFHEAGHQVAHMTGWVPELAANLRSTLGPSGVGEMWAAWASEIAADAFAHVHSGYGAAVALHDVLDGNDESVFRLLEGDPHPVAWLRVHLVLAMCQHTFGAGPWNELGTLWNAKHPLSRCVPELRASMEESLRQMPLIAAMVLHTPVRGFGTRPLTQLIDSQRVSPKSLAALEKTAGTSAKSSRYWLWNESIRLTALNALRAAQSPTRFAGACAYQEHIMRMLGWQRQMVA